MEMPVWLLQPKNVKMSLLIEKAQIIEESRGFPEDLHVAFFKIEMSAMFSLHSQENIAKLHISL